MDSKNNEALVRKMKLKTLLDKGLETGRLICQQSMEQTLANIRDINVASNAIIDEGHVGDRAEHTTEVVLDAEVQRMNHELLSMVLEQSSDFNETVYQNAIKAMVFKDNCDSNNWLEITKIACGISRTARVKSSMLGIIDVEPPKPQAVKQRQKRVKNTKVAEEKQPETIVKMKRVDKGAQKVNLVNQQLSQLIRANHNNPLPFYQLIIDPTNFMYSVDNAFQLAFLAVANVIAIFTGPDGHPHVRFTTPEEQQRTANTQSICTLNLKIYREMIAYYNIKESMLNIHDNDEDDGDGEHGGAYNDDGEEDNGSSSD